MQATCELRPTPCETSQKAKAFQDTQQLRPTAQGVETALGLSVALQVLHPGDLAVAESCGHLLGLGLPGWKALGGSRGSPGLFGLFAPCASIAHAGFRPASCTFQPEPDGVAELDEEGILLFARLNSASNRAQRSQERRRSGWMAAGSPSP
ncbi:interleukin-15 isoform X10 [Rattus norvegicus]|uniref:interleukin-15 isoform X10 n=1 Tax=Rattus norvegicus TaxID=10116 RepID=UPI001916CCD1